MLKLIPLTALALALMSGCSGTVSSNNSTVTIRPNEVPAAVQGAFDSEHPYAKMNEPKRVTNSDGVITYVIPYTRTDSSTGTASYSDMGELKSEN
jgi:ABC-type Fe3+-hydroxamate transport system substrate-binding protein